MGASHWNEHCSHDPLGPAPREEARDFHRRLPGYRSSPLIAAASLARELGVGELSIKLEVDRFGLPAFKILGGSWAAYRLLARELDPALPTGWRDLGELRERLRALLPCTLVTATDGNHGRGVAAVARLFGLDASVYVPAGTARARVAAIAGEGARVTVVDGSYDETVREAARDVEDGEGRRYLVQDTSWEGYEEVPRWVIEGYVTMMLEIDEQLAELARRPPDVMIVPIGVGALLAAVIAYVRHRGQAQPGWRATHIVGVEPLGADCTLAALRADAVVTVDGPQTSIMAGLNCGTLASIVWPLVRAGLDATLAIEDSFAADAMRLAQRHGMSVGESGAASLAGLLALLREDEHASIHGRLGLGPASHVLLFATEGVTDPENWRRTVGS